MFKPRPVSMPKSESMTLMPKTMPFNYAVHNHIFKIMNHLDLDLKRRIYTNVKTMYPDKVIHDLQTQQPEKTAEQIAGQIYMKVIQKLASVGGSKRTKSKKQPKEKEYTGLKGGKYVIRNGKKVYKAKK